MMHLDQLWFSWLLPLCFCLEPEEPSKLVHVHVPPKCIFAIIAGTIVKTVGRGPDVFPLCARALLHKITLIVCKIETKSITREHGCVLLFEPEKGFQQRCGDRFTLKTDNQTVFLQLNKLTPEHSGNYSCDCSYLEGAENLHLHVTVEAGEKRSSLFTITNHMVVISTAVGFAVVAGVLLGLSLRKTRCRCCRRSERLEINDKQENSYACLQQPAGDLYQTTSVGDHHYTDVMGAKPARKAQTPSLASAEQTEDIYENL